MNMDPWKKGKIFIKIVRTKNYSMALSAMYRMSRRRAGCRKLLSCGFLNFLFWQIFPDVADFLIRKFWPSKGEGVTLIPFRPGRAIWPNMNFAPIFPVHP